jgi:hypothetical protein
VIGFPRLLGLLLFKHESSIIHPLFANPDRPSGDVNGAAIEVHRIMGPRLLESIYKRCLVRELLLRSVPIINQQKVVIDYVSVRNNQCYRGW